MADFEEKRYSIDPGKGKKMDGCPYSNFEDGHDVQEYIIPPKGYVFSGFRFDPDASNQIYDGKLYAIYTKEPFNIRLKSNLWKLMLALIVAAVIGLIILLVFSVFKKSSTTNEPAKEPKTEIKAKPADKKKKKDKKTDQSLIEKKEDKTKARQGETLDFKVIEFSKENKKIIVSHTRVFQDNLETERQKSENEEAKKERATKKTVKKINETLEKTTLGDLSVLASLKEEIEKEQKGE